jgi:hypothetical protein
MVIPNRDAAKQIVSDISNDGRFFELIAMLINMHTDGLRGKRFAISNLKEIIKEAQNNGYIYDTQNRIFVEDPLVRKTKNWGALVPGQEYTMAFLRIDIAGNSRMVREHPQEIIQYSYADLKNIVDRAQDRRNGRMWSWEGDGGLAAFYFGNKLHMALYSGMEILNELFIYNLVYNRLSEPIQVRIAVHMGMCEYTDDFEKIFKSDTIKKTIELESCHTKPNSMTVSSTIHMNIDPVFTRSFVMFDAGGMKLARYSVEMER